MLGKLIKYDLFALGRVLLPVQLALLGFGILVTIFSTLNMRAMERRTDLTSHPVDQMLLGFGDTITVLMYLIILMLVALIFAAWVMTVFFTARHFYQSIFTNEGYLTMTLPATTRQHMVSKAVSGFCWLVLCLVVMLLVICLLFFFGFATKGLVSEGSLDFVYRTLKGIIDSGGVVLLAEYPLQILLSTISVLLCVYACIAAGCALAQKHKIAIALLFIFCIWVVTSIIGSIVDGFFMISSYNSIMNSLSFASGAALRDLASTSQIQLAVKMALDVAYCAGYILLIHHILSKRLNLE